jgi:hypothetical protein
MGKGFPWLPAVSNGSAITCHIKQKIVRFMINAVVQLTGSSRQQCYRIFFCWVHISTDLGAQDTTRRKELGNVNVENGKAYSGTRSYGHLGIPDVIVLELGTRVRLLHATTFFMR